MADNNNLEDAEFWLPSEFLTDEDILMDINNKKTGSNSLQFTHSFLPEFPYDHGRSSSVDPSLASLETESDEDDSLLTGLTRQLSLSESHNNKKSWVLSTSPQSTLTPQVGSWSGRSSPNGPSQVSSPPTTPLTSKNDAWDLIYQAAGEVARLKIRGGDVPTTMNIPVLTRPQKWLVTPPPPKTPLAVSPFHHNQIRGLEMLNQSGCGMRNREVKSRWSYEQEIALNNTPGGWNVNGRGFDPPPSRGWPNTQVRQRPPPPGGDLGFRESVMCMGNGYGSAVGAGGGGGGGGGGGLKRGRTGTGVFIPRVNTSDSRKKPGSSPANLHSGRVMHDLNKMMASVPQSHPQALFDFRSAADYDMLISRRNALLMQQRRNLRPEGSMSREICLPQEWTY